MIDGSSKGGQGEENFTMTAMARPCYHPFLPFGTLQHQLQSFRAGCNVVGKDHACLKAFQG